MSAATITKRFERTVNIFTVTHPDLPNFKREFIGNKNQKAAAKYAKWLNELAAKQKAAKAEAHMREKTDFLIGTDTEAN